MKILESTPNVQPAVRACGLVALVLAVISALMPTFGILAMIPPTVVLGAIAMYGGLRGIGAGVLVMCSMDAILSPTFWANLTWTGMHYSLLDHTLTYFDLVGIIAMSALLFKPFKSGS
ncbi:hypothetical protein [Alicyclobacillus acidiphilus]|uniref:hypothetical protein n=1 Tax=Alicyclobacillus acidiphilus TaxID=182455 RepID=UPI000833DDEE|nr:hypothetical protein [Alicyclobacillus acidiphilus]